VLPDELNDERGARDDAMKYRGWLLTKRYFFIEKNSFSTYTFVFAFRILHLCDYLICEPDKCVSDGEEV